MLKIKYRFDSEKIAIISDLYLFSGNFDLLGALIHFFSQLFDYFLHGVTQRHFNNGLE